jgi:MFS family permease
LTASVANGEDMRRRTIVFSKLFLVFLFAATAGLMVLSQAAAIFTAYGATKATALAATTGITAAIAAARVGGGVLIDRLPVPVVAASAQAIALAGAVLLTLVPTPEVAIPTLGMIGIGYGLISGVVAGAIAFYWPKALFGRTASRIYIAWCLAALTLPVVAARLFDLTGGYHTAIVLAGVANLCGVIVGSSLPRQERRT